MHRPILSLLFCLGMCGCVRDAKSTSGVDSASADTATSDTGATNLLRIDSAAEVREIALVMMFPAGAVRSAGEYIGFYASDAGRSCPSVVSTGAGAWKVGGKHCYQRASGGACQVRHRRKL